VIQPRIALFAQFQNEIFPTVDLQDLEITSVVTNRDTLAHGRLYAEQGADEAHVEMLLRQNPMVVEIPQESLPRQDDFINFTERRDSIA